MKTTLLAALILFTAPTFSQAAAKKTANETTAASAPADASCYNLAVSGMHCASCHGIISSAVPEGKLEVSPKSPAEGTMKICGGKLPADAAIKKITDLGYKAKKI
jgi:copper chaperone CopZ